jgi:hypothetical protein
VQRFFADNWPIRLWLAVVPLAAPAAVCWFADPLPWALAHWLNAALFAGLLALAWCAGWFAALVPGWFVLAPLYFSRGLSNGAPYQVGDCVRVLARRQRGRVARVYEVWGERDQVRVELGEEARARFEDVFSYHEVCRETETPNPALHLTAVKCRTWVHECSPRGR